MVYYVGPDSESLNLTTPLFLSFSVKLNLPPWPAGLYRTLGTGIGRSASS